MNVGLPCCVGSGRFLISRTEAKTFFGNITFTVETRSGGCRSDRSYKKEVTTFGGFSFPLFAHVRIQLALFPILHFRSFVPFNYRWDEER